MKKHPEAKNFAGKHVLVIGNEVLPLKKGKSGLKDLETLEKRYGRAPTIVFVPRPDITYILTVISQPVFPTAVFLNSAFRQTQ